jgi:hypothetical protein
MNNVRLYEKESKRVGGQGNVVISNEEEGPFRYDVAM